MNIGSVINKGVEFEFDAQVLKAKDFSFEIYGNVSENNDEVLSCLLYTSPSPRD